MFADLSVRRRHLLEKYAVLIQAATGDELMELELVQAHFKHRLMTGMRECVICQTLFVPDVTRQYYCGFMCRSHAQGLRVKDGLARARTKGTRLDRPVSIAPIDGSVDELTVRAAALALGISKSTIARRRAHRRISELRQREVCR